MKIVTTDLDFDNVGRIKNLPTPIDSNDAVTLEYLVNNTGFSFKKIISSNILKIPLNQQMIVVDGIEIEGSLDIEGELCLIS